MHPVAEGKTTKKITKSFGISPKTADNHRTRMMDKLGPRRFGCDTCFLEIGADNAATIALYEAEGFPPIGRRPSYYGRRTDAVVYAGSTRPRRSPR